jgi:MFS family permease
MMKGRVARSIFVGFLPFWLFLLFFKFAGALHYTLLSPFGERLLPIWVVGLLIGGESLLQMALDIPAGYLLDRFGYKRLLAYTTIFFLVAAVSIALGLSILTYLLTIFFSTFGWLFFVPGQNAYILSQTSEEQSGRFFSLRDISNSVGVVLASVSLPFALLLPVRSAGIILLVLLAIALVFLLGSPDDRRLPAHTDRSPLQKIHYPHQRLRALATVVRKLSPASGMLVLLTCASSIFYGTIWFVVPLVIAMEQANAGILAIGLGIFDFAVVVLGYVIGLMVDRTDKRALVFFGLLIFSVFGILVGFNFGLLFILFGFLATTGDEMAGISLWSWLHHLDREHIHDGSISAAITVFDDLGYAIGPMLAGLTYAAFGPAWAISLGAIPIFLAWVVYSFYVEKRIPYEPFLVLLPHRPRRRKHKS